MDEYITTCAVCGGGLKLVQATVMTNVPITGDGFDLSAGTGSTEDDIVMCIECHTPSDLLQGNYQVTAVILPYTIRLYVQAVTEDGDVTEVGMMHETTYELDTGLLPILNDAVDMVREHAEMIGAAGWTLKNLATVEDMCKNPELLGKVLGEIEEEIENGVRQLEYTVETQGLEIEGING